MAINTQTVAARLAERLRAAGVTMTDEQAEAFAAAFAGDLTEWTGGAEAVPVALANKVTSTATAWNTDVMQRLDWWTGPADGGPNGDGLYPMVNASGEGGMFPSLAKIFAVAGTLGGDPVGVIVEVNELVGDAVAAKVDALAARGQTLTYRDAAEDFRDAAQEAAAAAAQSVTDAAMLGETLADRISDSETATANAQGAADIANTLLGQAYDILDGIPSLGFNAVTIETEAPAGTHLGALPPSHTYTLIDGAAGKVVMSAGLPVLAAEGPGSPTSFVYVIQATPVNGGQVLMWAIKVRVTTDLVELLASSLTIPIEAVEGDVIAALSGMTEGSTLALAPSDGRLVLDGDEIKRGPAAVALGSIPATVTETLEGARNTPRDTNLTFTVAKNWDYYVDSEAGSDANDGLTPATAFLTTAKAATMTLTNKKLGLRRRATYYRGNASITANNLTLSAYGPAGDPKPMLDDSRLITGLAPKAGTPGVSQATIALPNSVKSLGNVTRNGVLMVQVATSAAVATTPNSFWVQNWQSASSTIEINTSVDTGGEEYRYGYDIALSITGANIVLTDIAGRLNGAQDGVIKVAGEGSVNTRIDLSLGARHVGYWGFNSTFEYCTGTGGRNDLEVPGTSNLFVINQPATAGKGYSSSNCTLSSGGYPTVTGWQNHGSDAEELCAYIYHDHDTYDRLSQCSDVQAVDYKDISPTYINCEQGLYVGRGASAVAEVSDGAGSINRIYEVARPSTIKLLRANLSIPMLGGATVGFCRGDNPTGDVTLEIRDSTFQIVNGPSINAQFIRHKRGLVKLYDTTIKPSAGETLGAQVDQILVAGFPTGTIASYEGDRNVFPYGASFTFNGVVYPTLAAWQAYWASQGQTHDANSVTQQPKAPTASDAFNRADENLDVTWTRIGGAAGQAAVRSNSLAAIGTTQTAYRLANMASPNMYARFTVRGVPSTAGPMVALRLVDQSNSWGLRWNATTWQWGKFVDGVPTVSVQSSTAVAPAVGQDVIVAIEDDRVWLYVDGRCLIRGLAIPEPALAGASGAGVLVRNTVINPWIDDLKFGPL